MHRPYTIAAYSSNVIWVTPYAQLLLALLDCVMT